MTDSRSLEKRIDELEDRLKAIEDKLAPIPTDSDEQYMTVLYNQAKALVKKHGLSSITFLQRKLWIDFQRASQLRQKLQKDGIIEKE